MALVQPLLFAAQAGKILQPAKILKGLKRLGQEHPCSTDVKIFFFWREKIENIGSFVMLLEEKAAVKNETNRNEYEPDQGAGLLRKKAFERSEKGIFF